MRRLWMSLLLVPVLAIAVPTMASAAPAAPAALAARRTRPGRRLPHRPARCSRG